MPSSANGATEQRRCGSPESNRGNAMRRSSVQVEGAVGGGLEVEDVGRQGFMSSTSRRPSRSRRSVEEIDVSRLVREVRRQAACRGRRKHERRPVSARATTRACPCPASARISQLDTLREVWSTSCRCGARIFGAGSQREAWKGGKIAERTSERYARGSNQRAH